MTPASLGAYIDHLTAQVAQAGEREAAMRAERDEARKQRDELAAIVRTLDADNCPSRAYVAARAWVAAHPVTP